MDKFIKILEDWVLPLSFVALVIYIVTLFIAKL